MKWSRTGDGRCGRAAERFIEEAFQHIDSGLRIDVLVWDTEEARHRVERREDDRNYERMFYHLLKTALRKRPRGSE